MHHSPQEFLGFLSMVGKANMSSVSSHLILNDPLEEPQPTFIDERGEVMIKDFDERTLWSSDWVPLIATYNRDKMQHSLWLVKCVNSYYGQEAFSSSHFHGSEVSPKHFSFQRIWQAKGSQTAATKGSLATDENASPIICLLFQEQKSLLSMRLQVVKKNDYVLVDIKAELGTTRMPNEGGTQWFSFPHPRSIELPIGTKAANLPLDFKHIPRFDRENRVMNPTKLKSFFRAVRLSRFAMIAKHLMK